MSKVQLERAERLKRVCKRVIAGDNVTKTEFESAVLKYVHTQYDDPTRVLKRLYHDEGELGCLLRKAAGRFINKELDDQEISPLTGAAYSRTRQLLDDDDADDDRDDDDNDDNGDIEKQADHHASTVANLLVEAGSFPHRAAALQHLLHKPSGQALLSRMSKRNPPMDTVYDIMKAGSITGFCAAVVAKRRTSISQDDLVSAVGKVARERWPELSEAQAYAKVDADPIEGPVLRQAVNVTRASLAETMLGVGLPVTVVTGPAAQDVNTAEEAEAARAELMRIGRKQWPRLTENQAYEQAFSDPRNATLVARLYQRPTPTSIYPLPNEWLRGDGTQHAKSDRGSAYGDLMEKAEEYRNSHPELSISQAFAKVYTDPANVEVAKRERVENAVR